MSENFHDLIYSVAAVLGAVWGYVTAQEMTFERVKRHFTFAFPFLCGAVIFHWLGGQNPAGVTYSALVSACMFVVLVLWSRASCAIRLAMPFIVLHLGLLIVAVGLLFGSQSQITTAHVLFAAVGIAIGWRGWRGIRRLEASAGEVVLPAT